MVGSSIPPIRFGKLSYRTSNTIGEWERHRRYVAEYEKMLAVKTPAELRELSELGLEKPLPWDLGFGPPRRDDEDENPADRVIDSRTAVDEVEPLISDQSELAEIAQCFHSALVWASQAKSLVDMGWRIHAMLVVFRPVLLDGMALEARLQYERELRRSMGCSRQMTDAVGDHYRSVLAWCRRCNGWSQMGQRGFAMIYVMARQLIGRLSTNAALGGLSNKTRQAFNKTVQDFADSNHGFRNGVMRGERTRIKCRIAQTSKR